MRGEVLASNTNTVLQRRQGYGAAYFGRYVSMLRRNVTGNHPEMEAEISSETDVPFHQNTRASNNYEIAILYNLYPCTHL